LEKPILPILQTDSDRSINWENRILQDKGL
jgi:hypothetical protein